MQAGDKVHVATKDHRSFDNATVISDDRVELVLEADNSLTAPSTIVVALQWSEIVFCEEQDQWNLEQSLLNEEEEDNDDDE